MAYLECRNISKAFGAVRALHNVSLSFEAGEVRAILGGNGSGKSTLAKILGGSVFTDSGTIALEGKNLDLSSPIHAKRNGIIVTSQELSLLANLNVFENVMLCGLPRWAIFVDQKTLAPGGGGNARTFRTRQVRRAGNRRFDGKPAISFGIRQISDAETAHFGRG